MVYPIIYSWLVVLTILKNISQLGVLFPYIMENKKCLKPPTRLEHSGTKLDGSGYNLQPFTQDMITRCIHINMCNLTFFGKKKTIMVINVKQFGYTLRSRHPLTQL